MKPARIGVLGCGKVSRMYFPILERSPAIEVVAVADLDSSLAEAAAGTHQVGRAAPPEELLGDPSIELVVNLTPIAAHVETTRAVLAAGKHVYSEKPLATSTEDARGLVAEAERRGLALGCAPDTLLGSGFQTAWAALAAGRIGRPLAVSTLMFRRGLRAPSFYSEGATPFFDMAPYYVSALVCLLGPVRRVSGATRTWPKGVTPTEPSTGASIAVSGVLEFTGGATAQLTLAWGIGQRPEVTTLDVYGSDGILAVPNPNNFGNPAYIQPHGESGWTELNGSRQPDSWPPNLRGLGVAEMALAVQDGRTPRAGGELACHVVDVIAGLVRSGERGERVELTTTCAPPEPIPAELRDQLLT